MTVENVAPPVVGSRPLTTREVTTIRAALRVWTLLEGGRDAALITAGQDEVGGADAILADHVIDQLLVELGLAGDVTVTPLHPIDVRRI